MELKYTRPEERQNANNNSVPNGTEIPSSHSGADYTINFVNFDIPIGTQKIELKKVAPSSKTLPVLTQHKGQYSKAAFAAIWEYFKAAGGPDCKAVNFLLGDIRFSCADVKACEDLYHWIDKRGILAYALVRTNKENQHEYAVLIPRSYCQRFIQLLTGQAKESDLSKLVNQAIEQQEAAIKYKRTTQYQSKKATITPNVDHMPEKTYDLPHITAHYEKKTIDPNKINSLLFLKDSVSSKPLTDDRRASFTEEEGGGPSSPINKIFTLRKSASNFSEGLFSKITSKAGPVVMDEWMVFVTCSLLSRQSAETNISFLSDKDQDIKQIERAFKGINSFSDLEKIYEHISAYQKKLIKAHPNMTSYILNKERDKAILDIHSLYKIISFFSNSLTESADAQHKMMYETLVDKAYSALNLIKDWFGISAYESPKEYIPFLQKKDLDSQKDIKSLFFSVLEEVAKGRLNTISSQRLSFPLLNIENNLNILINPSPGHEQRRHALCVSLLGLFGCQRFEADKQKQYVDEWMKSYKTDSHKPDFVQEFLGLMVRHYPHLAIALILSEEKNLQNTMKADLSILVRRGSGYEIQYPKFCSQLQESYIFLMVIGGAIKKEIAELNLEKTDGSEISTHLGVIHQKITTPGSLIKKHFDLAEKMLMGKLVQVPLTPTNIRESKIAPVLEKIPARLVNLEQDKLYCSVWKKEIEATKNDLFQEADTVKWPLVGSEGAVVSVTCLLGPVEEAKRCFNSVIFGTPREVRRQSFDLS